MSYWNFTHSKLSWKFSCIQINQEAIAGKCNVVCISTDTRNPPPSAEEIQMASYVFYRIFDVKSLTIIDQIDDTVGGLEGIMIRVLHFQSFVCLELVYDEAGLSLLL